MDASERNKLRQLANDALIASLGSDSMEQRLAEGLERCVDDLAYITEQCDHCKYCDIHGEVEDDSIAVDVVELIRIQKALKESAGAFHRLYATEATEELVSMVDELEAEILP